MEKTSKHVSKNGDEKNAKVDIGLLQAEQKYIDGMEPPVIPKTWNSIIHKVTLRRYSKRIYAEVHWEKTDIPDWKDKNEPVLRMVRQLERILSALDKAGVSVDLEINL